MGFGALRLWKARRFQKEFPKYEYQKLRWIDAGITNSHLAIQIDALWQGLAYISSLAMPAFVIAVNSGGQLHLLEVIGLLFWLAAFGMES